RLHEAGARVEVLVRRPRVHWRRRWFSRRPLTLLAPLAYSPSLVGPAGMCWITELPDLIRLLPPEVRRRIDRRAMRPEADLPLRARLAGARITAGRAVGSAVATGGGLRLTLTDGTERCVDHALLATGYRVDVARYPFLTPDVLR